MDDRQKAKIERYLKNARGFLWDLLYDRDPRPTTATTLKQKDIYKRLKDEGFHFNDKRPYRYVTGELLKNDGIEKILKKLIIPQVDEIYGKIYGPQKPIDYLRECWKMGELPNWTYLHRLDIWKFYPFLEVNTQYKYIAGWGEFAGVWFEEIEPIKEQLGA